MRVSYLLYDFGKTGGSIVLYNFMDNLVKRGYEVYAVTPYGRYKWEIGMWKELIIQFSNDKLAKKIVKNIIHPYMQNNKKAKRLKTVYQWNKSVKGLINNWKQTDVTISTYCITAYAGFYLSDQTIPLYHMQHFEELFFQDRIQRLVARNTYKLPLIKISNSSWLRHIVKKYFNEESYLLNPGIDLGVFKEGKGYLEKYRTKKKWTIVSFFDEQREWKGFNDAVKAVKKARDILSSQGIEIIWKVFGLNPPTKSYETEFEYVGKLFNEQLSKLYQEADIVLLTSWYESFPLPPIEAMASGSLIISTQYGVEDYIIDGKNGLVTLPRKIEEIANKIVWAIQNPQEVQSLVINGVATAHDYSWDKRTDVLENILVEVTKNYKDTKYKLFDDLVYGRFGEYMYEEFK
ncbi:glycosyltransferase involved in cell wall biosynthesis [Anoxybacillus tengchongensis]|uniref:Glycosyltransferase involved in cell wall biosynthesis n=1 Tax=Anoxybacillus tengchongensis TaxID=576944 RepID=A0A7W9YQ17_9BACL|nr:glycosyltransferase family 4 protein [Anoxybacillus tengchongensis]MBB6176100.1 glycosyltransferase involved in cell wall biosynthesis [Anoxybacillus tengchongensis]